MTLAQAKTHRQRPPWAGTAIGEAQKFLNYSREATTRFYNEGRISERAWEALNLAFRWLSPRFSSAEQEIFYVKYGRRAYYRKIDRVRRAFGVAPLTYPPGFFG